VSTLEEDSVAAMLKQPREADSRRRRKKRRVAPVDADSNSSVMLQCGNNNVIRDRGVEWGSPEPTWGSSKSVSGNLWSRKDAR
jgi:hypothetical protein